MPNPTRGDVHVNRPLTNISIAYMQAANAFVADRVFPNIPVRNQSDVYFRYDRSDFWRNGFRERAPATESAGSGWKLDTQSYSTRVYALHKDIDDQIRSNEDTPLSLERDATLWLAQQGLIAREVTWADNYFVTGVWSGVTGSTGTDITGVSSSPGSNQVLQWNDAASAPIADIKAQATSIQELTGYRPNKLVVGRAVWDQLSEHPDVIDRIKYSGGVSPSSPAVVTRAAVAALMELDEILVADGIQSTGEENPAFETSMTNAFVMGKAALLIYAAPSPAIMQPSGGYTFSWTGYLGAGAMGQRTKRFRMEQLAADRVESEMAYVQKIVCTDCGVYFATIVA